MVCNPAVRRSASVSAGDALDDSENERQMASGVRASQAPSEAIIKPLHTGSMSIFRSSSNS
eukprot:CAMPEP_0205915016 /NCGR_PEP_ID=MMETSP1325-20131115/7585_1 /ASSEMBLY_ACC=CAM_ASM_000708 /TAXON_ID=236786 /ORGANISM="Florenciella sp., Strain RCC1007" /LENGTH=60 /DNA_ID=CAMNT_0053282135 /DNA_START=144 /DNA_END=326 /DNA_ORIENTATION=-